MILRLLWQNTMTQTFHHINLNTTYHRENVAGQCREGKMPLEGSLTCYVRDVGGQ